MKLRLFGCAAAFALAGTLCASAQDAPQSKTKEGASEAAPPAESRDKSPAREMKETPANRSESAERGSQDRADRKADKTDAKADRKAAKDESDTKRSRADNESGDAKEKSNKAADKSDRSGPDKPSNAANDNPNTQRDKAAKREGQSDADRAAESKQDSGAVKDRQQATDRTDKAGADKAGKNVQLSADKRDRVQSTLRSDSKLKHETNVDVNISIGTRAPRTWAFAPVPVAVVELVPEYRGYVVAYVEDEYVICDPDTYEVVALLPASGGGDYATTGRSSGESGAATQCTTSLTLSESDRDAILKEVQMSDEIDASGVTVGWSVPSDVELKTLPSSIVDRSSTLSGCRYFIVDGQVALVNPDQHEVVLLIEHR